MSCNWLEEARLTSQERVYVLAKKEIVGQKITECVGERQLWFLPCQGFSPYLQVQLRNNGLHTPTHQFTTPSSMVIRAEKTVSGMGTWVQPLDYRDYYYQDNIFLLVLRPLGCTRDLFRSLRSRGSIKSSTAGIKSNTILAAPNLLVCMHVRARKGWYAYIYVHRRAPLLGGCLRAKFHPQACPASLHNHDQRYK